MGRTTIEEEEQISGLILIPFNLKCYSPLCILSCHTISSILDGLWPFTACSLFPLYLNLLQPCPCVFYTGFALCLVPFIIALDEEKSLLQGLETYTLGFLVTVLTEITGCVHCC